MNQHLQFNKQFYFYPQHDKVLEQWTEDFNTAVLCPTGSGKTGILLRMIVRKYLKVKASKSFKALVICPTNILVDQFIEKAKVFTNFEVCKLHSKNLELFLESRAEKDAVMVTTAHFAALRLIKLRMPKFDYSFKSYFDFLGIDEYHHSLPTNFSPSTQTIYQRIINSYKKPYVGFSATVDAKKLKAFKKYLNLEEVIEGKSPNVWNKNLTFQGLEFEQELKALKLKIDDYLIKKYSSILKQQFNFTLNNQTLDYLVYYLSTKAIKRVLKQKPYLYSSYYRIHNLAYSRYVYFYQSLEAYQKYKKTKKIYDKAYDELFSNSYKNSKFQIILDLLKKNKSGESVILFLENYATLIGLRDYLIKNGLGESIAIISGKTKNTPTYRNKMIAEIKNNNKNIILCTSVAQEGVDIGSASKVIFYKPVSSKLRFIQRCGRTGRNKDGEVEILYYKNTLEERITSKHLKTE